MKYLVAFCRRFSSVFCSDFRMQMFVFILISNVMCMSTVLAATLYDSRENVEVLAKNLATEEWGVYATLENSMQYEDFDGLQFATGFYFVDYRDNKPLGTIVMSNLKEAPPLIEIIYGYSLHDEAIDELQEQMSGGSNLRILNVIYYPFLPPIIKFSVASSRPIQLFVDGRVIDMNNVDAKLKTLSNDLFRVKPFPKKKESSQLVEESYREDRSSATATPDKILEVHEINVRGRWRGCTPAAAANILGYFDDNGLGFLVSGNSETATNSDINALLKEVAVELKTTSFAWEKDANGNEICDGSGGSTKLREICQGLISAAKNHGYEFECETDLIPTFRDVKQAIRKNIPAILSGQAWICDFIPTATGKAICAAIFPQSIYHYHSTVAIGFYDGVLSDAVLIHDGWPASSFCGSTGKDKPKKIDWNWFLWYGGSKPFRMNTVTPVLYGKVGCPDSPAALSFKLPFTPNGELIKTKLTGYDYNGAPIYFDINGSHVKETGNTTLKFSLYADSSHNTHVRTDKCVAVLSEHDPAFSDQSCELIRDTNAGCTPLWVEMDWNSVSESGAATEGNYWSDAMVPMKSLISTVPRN